MKFKFARTLLSREKRSLIHCWYQKTLHPLSFILLPLSWLFGFCVASRRWLYRSGLLKTYQFKVPVIVVGNITVGGTGKTPFVIWLVQFLQAQGFNPGIVSRGVGGKKHSMPYTVKGDDSAAIVGDEALLLSRNVNCPFVISRDRVAAANDLIQHFNCNVIISDDGLQHYRLARHIEIAMVDGIRRTGNNRLLPAGPLREKSKRLQEVDFVIVNGGQEHDEWTMTVQQTQIISLRHPQHVMNLHDFPHRHIHAVAAIGHPERFFNALTQLGFKIIEHRFPDHHHFKKNEINFNDDFPIIMTEKDAVKCTHFADERYWYVPITVKIKQSFEKHLLNKLEGLQ